MDRWASVRTSLATVGCRCCSGYGVTLVPRWRSTSRSATSGEAAALRAAAAGRTVGLAWRHTSPRKADFVELGQIVTETLGTARGRLTPAAPRRPARSARRDMKGCPRFLDRAGTGGATHRATDADDAIARPRWP